MIVLENRYKIGTYIIIEEDIWSIKQKRWLQYHSADGNYGTPALC